MLQIFHHLPIGESGIWWFARRMVDGVEQRQGSWAGTPSELLAFAEHYEGWNFYVQPNPSARRTGLRCAEKDISRWSWFLIDLDPAPTDPAFVNGERGLEMSTQLDDAVARIQDLMNSYFGLRSNDPTIIHSGRGRQIWYRLFDKELGTDKDPVLWTPPPKVDLWAGALTAPIEGPRPLELRKAARWAQGHWLHFLDDRLRVPGVHVDHSCADLPRLMRCPGTYNTKTGELARILHLGSFHFHLADHLLRYAPRELFDPEPMQLVKKLTGAPWQMAVPFLTKKAADFLTLGVPEPGRHAALVAAARSLNEAGIGKEEARKGIYRGALLCRPALNDRDYIERVLEDTFKA